MDLDALQAFAKTARLGDTAAAAEALGRAEAALVRHIELLEEQLGTRLLDRSRRRMTPTRAGEVLLPFVEEALSAWNEGAEALKLLRSRVPHTLELALVGALSSTGIAPAVQDLQRRYPDTRVIVYRASSAEVSHLVRQGRAGLGLRYGEEPSSQLVCRIIAEEAFEVVVAADHPLARRMALPVSALAQERWVACLGARGCQEVFIQLITKRLSAAGLAGAELTPVGSLAAQKRLIQAGFGVGLMPLGTIVEELRRGSLVALSIPSLSFRIPICAVYPRRGPVSIMALRLLELLIRHGVTAETSSAPAALPRAMDHSRAG